MTTTRGPDPFVDVGHRGRYTDFVEACYAPIDGESAWLCHLASATQTALGAPWAQAVSFLIADGTVELGTASDPEFAAAWGPERRLPASHTPAFAEFDLAGLREVMKPAEFDVAVEANPPPPEMVASADVMFALQGRASATSGVMAFWAAPRPLAPAERGRLRKLAAHLRAAVRVRAHRPAIEAILDHTGRVHHAEAPAKARRSLQTLSRGAKAIERARTVRTVEALETWHALWDGRWTLIDSFDKDGKRWLVAKSNHATTPADTALQPRERDVALGAAAGRSLKLMAYELGLPLGTVASTLTRAMRKLRVRNRAELARLVSSLVGEPP